MNESKYTTKYICNTCHENYKTEEEVVRCYDRGLFTPIIPLGTIMGLSSDEMVFVVVKYNFDKQDKHRGSYLLHAFRDTDAGDNETGQYCGDDFFKIHHLLTGVHQPYYSEEELLNGSKYNVPNLSIPAFQRAKNYVKDKGLKPRIWDGVEIIEI